MLSEPKTGGSWLVAGVPVVRASARGTGGFSAAGDIAIEHVALNWQFARTGCDDVKWVDANYMKHRSNIWFHNKL